MSLDFIHLAGADDVARAGSAMRQAAEEMQRAASNLAAALAMHERWMDDWLSRFQSVMETACPPRPMPDDGMPL